MGTLGPQTVPPGLGKHLEFRPQSPNQAPPLVEFHNLKMW